MTRNMGLHLTRARRFRSLFVGSAALIGAALLGACGSDTTVSTQATIQGSALPDSGSGNSGSGNSGSGNSGSGNSGSGNSGSDNSGSDNSGSAPSNNPVATVPPGIDGGPTPPVPSQPGAGSEPGASGDSVVSSPAQLPADITIPPETYDNAGEVATDPNAENPHPVPLLRLEAVDEEIRMVWYGGVCDRISSVNVEESATEVVVDLQVGTEPGVTACIEMAVLSRTSVALAGGLGSRTLVDKNAG